MDEFANAGKLSARDLSCLSLAGKSLRLGMMSDDAPDRAPFEIGQGGGQFENSHRIPNVCPRFGIRNPGT